MLYLANDQHCKQITVSLRDEVGHVLCRGQLSTQPESRSKKKIDRRDADCIGSPFRMRSPRRPGTG